MTTAKSKISKQGVSAAKALKLQAVTWQEHVADIMKVRMSVFVDEQKVPADDEVDMHDPDSYHVAVYDAKRRPVATARLTKDGWIGRMAVLKAYRGHGIGQRMLVHLMKKAIENGNRIIELSAQTHAIPFYQKFGFSTVGRIYDDAGIPHQKMIYIHKPKNS